MDLNSPCDRIKLLFQRLPPMKPLFFLLLLSLLGFATKAKGEEEITLNSTQTPDDVGTFYLDDVANTGEVSSGPRERIALMDHQNAIQVGDVGNESNSIPGRIRKTFLLFRLPDLQGKSIKEAVLTLDLGQIHRDGPAPLPPLFLLHAKQWDAGQWESDGARRGLQLSDYADVENFSTRKDVCGPGHQAPTPMRIDVTEMIKADYERGARPVAAFRMEVGDQQSLDIGDELYNFYVFVGPGQLTRGNGEPMPESSRPSLTLIVE
jgi:hypothetical protein